MLYTRVRVANGEEIDEIGKGTIRMKISNGEKIMSVHLKDVLYVQKIYANLMSGLKIANKGNTSWKCFLKR